MSQALFKGLQFARTMLPNIFPYDNQADQLNAVTAVIDRELARLQGPLTFRPAGSGFAIGRGDGVRPYPKAPAVLRAVYDAIKGRVVHVGDYATGKYGGNSLRNRIRIAAGWIDRNCPPDCQPLAEVLRGYIRVEAGRVIYAGPAGVVKT